MQAQYSIAQARDNLSRIVRNVERGAAIELTRRGKAVAVLLSANDYQRLATGRPGFWEAFEAFRRQTDLEQLAIEPQVFAGLRDSAPGREVSW